MTAIVLAALIAAAPAAASPSPLPAYSIDAIRYATVPQFPLASLVMRAPAGEKVDIALTAAAGLGRSTAAARLSLVDGADVEILPGLRVYTGARHTFASEYLRVDGPMPVVLASDNCYLYRNLETHAASATFSEAD